MTAIELIHAAAIGVYEIDDPMVFQYLNELLCKWITLQT